MSNAGSRPSPPVRRYAAPIRRRAWQADGAAVTDEERRICFGQTAASVDQGMSAAFLLRHRQLY